MPSIGNSSESSHQQILSGFDVLWRDSMKKLRGLKLGILCHPASCDSSYVHILDRAHEASLTVAALFGPEHGLTGFAQDMEGVGGESDKRFSAPVYSLYGASAASLSPTQEMLQGLDAVVIDLFDIGTRYYTFVWTAVLMMRACARAKVKVLILDRPNPLGGNVVEGGGIDQGFFSFVGLYDVPVRHGMTVGEMCTLVKNEEKLQVELEVVGCENWHRERLGRKKYACVLPSPNMPTKEIALVYPGMCLLEATNVSEARGTTKPFEFFGAPWIDGHKMAGELHALQLPGLLFRALQFKPMFHKYAREICGGVELHVTDPGAFLPFRTGLQIVRTLQRLYPRDFAWRKEPYEFVSEVNAFDLLTGCSAYRENFADEEKFQRVCSEREARAQAFLTRRKESLLY